MTFPERHICIYVIRVTQVAHGLQICLILFDDDVMYIKEWEELNVKILKRSYLKNRPSVFPYLVYICCLTHVHGIKALNLINMHSGRC